MKRWMIVAVVVSGFLTAGALAKAVNRTLFAQTPPTQAVIETSAGTFIIDLAPEGAPNHVAYFIKQAQEGAYAGTIFHRSHTPISTCRPCVPQRRFG